MQKPWILALEKSFETFITVSISDMPTIKYWQNLGTFMDTAKEKVLNQRIISDTCFTSLATIRGNLFTRHPKNINRVYKDTNNLMSVTIVLGKDVLGREKNLME